MTARTMARPTMVRTIDPVPEAPEIFFVPPPSAGRFSAVSSPVPDAANAVAGASSTRLMTADAVAQMKGGIRNGDGSTREGRVDPFIGRRAGAFRTNVHGVGWRTPRGAGAQGAWPRRGRRDGDRGGVAAGERAPSPPPN